MTTPFAIAVAVTCLALSGCGAESQTSATSTADATSTTAPTTIVITIESSRFSMSEVAVRVGDTIRFEQRDPHAHTVTDAGDDPRFDSGEFGQGESFELTFDEPGVFDYFCLIHPTMRGRIVVS